MKAAIYSPYLDTLGGGERYCMAVATYLANKGYQVDCEWSDPSIKEKLEKRFGINLEKVNFIPSIGKGNNYDVCFWVSDGSIPLLNARKNFLHFQVPFTGVGGKSLLNRMKTVRINKFICNSNFTKSFIDKEFGVESVTLYPPVDVESIKAKRKENAILYVGRFSQLTQAKRQDVLIDVFKKMSNRMPEWKLILAGGVEVGGEEYVAELKKSVGDYQIEIIESPDYKTIKDLYGKSKIFWSAAGYGVNEQKEPKKVEHFGITLVEAMAGWCVPLVYNAGGFKEIITSGENGFLWSKTGDLTRQTIELVQEKSMLKKISEEARESSKKFNYERFYNELEKII